MKRKIFTIAIIIALLGGFLVLWPNVSSKNKKEERLYIRNGASLNEVLDSLKNKETLKCTFSLSLALRMVSFTSSLKQGSYLLSDGMNNLRIVNNIVKGRQTPIKLTFNNIRTKEQLCARLGQQIMADSAQLYSLLNDSSYLASLGVKKENAICVFLPDTYEMYWTVSPKHLFEKMHDTYLEFWTKERKDKAEKAGLSPNEAITLASIVEEESNMHEEQPTIAGLYLNRIHIKMKMQADPTVKFAVGDFSLKRITLKHINAARNSPYNTYTHIGLPPGPIRIPSKQTIDAVLNYEKHNYLYMCAKGNGGHGHNFSVNFNQHKLNAATYQNNMNKLGIH